jgi:DNA invertase Pin-like site-specific DNA recombinase
MEPKISKVAIYSRVSTNEQNNLNQEIRLIDYCKQRNWDYDVYNEIESTRKTRPIKQELLTKLRNKSYDAIVVYKLDRYARSSAELILEIKELLDKGISFISISENLDFSTATGKLQFQILSAFAEFERELIRERTKEGLNRAKAQGRFPGRPIGSKDKKQRPKSGYIIREALKRKKLDAKNGIHREIVNYISDK